MTSRDIDPNVFEDTLGLLTLVKPTHHSTTPYQTFIGSREDQEKVRMPTKSIKKKRGM
jgi:hypothetical protein